MGPLPLESDIESGDFKRDGCKPPSPFIDDSRSPGPSDVLRYLAAGESVSAARQDGFDGSGARGGMAEFSPTTLLGDNQVPHACQIERPLRHHQKKTDEGEEPWLNVESATAPQIASVNASVGVPPMTGCLRTSRMQSIEHDQTVRTRGSESGIGNWS